MALLRHVVAVVLLASGCAGPGAAPGPQAAPARGEPRIDGQPAPPVSTADSPPEPDHSTALALEGSGQSAPQEPRRHGRSLILLGLETATLDPGTHIYDRVCVQDDARINVRGSTTIILNSNQTTVIGGRGIGSVGSEKATIRIETQLAPDIFILFDNAKAPIQADLYAKRSKVSVGLTGKTGLNIGGEGAHTMQYYAGWGLPAQFPACDAELDREPEPSFPPSVHDPQNCVGRYQSSNYTAEPPAAQNAELHVIGVYEGTLHTNGLVEVVVNEARRPVILALSAYQPTRWQVTTGPQVRLKAIYVSGYHPQTVLGLSQNEKLHEVKFGTYAYGWEPKANTGGGSYLTMIRAVRKMTGMREQSFQGCYAGKRFEIPY